jgi:glycolate oxidase
MFKKLEHRHITELIGIVSKDNILTASEDLESFAKDETPDLYYKPEAVVRPSSTGQINEIIKLANHEKFPVVPRGGGTGLTGGALALHGGIIITFEHMKKIIDIDTKSRMAVLEPGVINGILQSEVEKFNLFYPINPASMDSCTLGGNMAEATGGANTVRYGTTRNYITGIRALTGNGLEWSAGGKIVKNSTDHTLIQLMCGSEGTLSIFTELTFRLLKKPLKNIWIIAPFRDIYQIPAAAQKLFSGHYSPTMIELMDSATLTYCSEYLGMDIQYSGHHQLLIRFDTNNPDELDNICKNIGNLCVDSGAADVLISETKTAQDKLWKIRSSIHEAIANKAKSVSEDDVVVPIAKITELLKQIYSLSERHGFPVVVFGHLGDGNMHINFTADKDFNTISVDKISALRDELFQSVVNLGGKLSGEHGIGISKKSYFKKFIDPGYINLMRNIKKDFDPNNILNPGKILD